MQERERFPRFPFSLFTFDFPEGIVRQPEPSSASLRMARMLHPARARARTPAAVAACGCKTLPSVAGEHSAPI